MDAEIHVEEHGSGPPLVLVHGLGGTGAAIWKKQVPELAREYRVVAFDLRGSGRSEVTPGPYAIDLHVRDLDDLLGQLDLDRAALAGHSMGGSIVLRYAADRPERVAAAVVVGGPATFPNAVRAGLRARADTVEAEGMAAVAETVATNGMAPGFRDANPEELRAYVALLLANDVRGYAAQCRGLAELDLEGDLPRIAAPVLLVGGDVDAVVPPGANERSAASVPSCELHVLEGCGHIIPWEKPAELVALVRPFLDRHA